MLVRYLLLVVLVNAVWKTSVEGESTFRESKDAQCGNIFIKKQFLLISENYPSPYPAGKECFYLLKGQNCTIQFNIEFLDFDVRSSVGCTKDRLEIGHQDALCGAVNGSKVYSAENGSLKLKFISENEPKENNRGFRALITRIDACEGGNSIAEGNITFINTFNPDITTDAAQVDWASKKAVLGPTYLPPLVKQCCQNNIYASKRFLLVSPNFPYSSNTPGDCIYIIKKASSEVCRLRINVLFFSLGSPSQNSCPYGHLEIDGKYICGCNSDLKLTTDFHDSESKVLRYHNSGYNTNDFYGFVLEVVQDECPKKYSPDDGILAERSFGKFRFYNDRYNKVAWPQSNNVDQLKLVNERFQSFPSENNGQERNIYKHFYFFAPKDEEDISWTQSGQEREETNYVEISTINTLLTSLYNYKQCVQWNRNQMILLNGRFGNSLFQMCKSLNENNVDANNCIVLNNLSGNIRSPRYPIFYPANQNICYRFQVLPGYCAINLLFDDFQIEQSYDCLKDYLAIDQYRYCGTYLKNKRVTLNSKGKSYQDLNFITDTNYCGKGFSAVYQQVLCQENDYPYPVSPNSCNPNDETTEIPLVDCTRIIREKYFTLQTESNANFCLFDIKKNSEEVCKIKLYFERFNLPCDSESITINGKVYCGQMSGRLVIIDLLDETTITYKKNNLYPTTEYVGDFLIQGTQISNDCEINTPEPARLTFRKSKANGIFPTGKWKKKIYPYHPDICELIKNNVTLEELPNKICDLLTKNDNIPECIFSKADIIDQSANDKSITKIQLTSGKAEELNYEVIKCQE